MPHGSPRNFSSYILTERAGWRKGAAEQLSGAERLLNEVGDWSGLVAVHLMLGNVLEKEMDYDSARVHYTEAVRQAELSGDDAALESAVRNLRSLDGDGR